jgi:hypothetical protein
MIYKVSDVLNPQQKPLFEGETHGVNLDRKDEANFLARHQFLGPGTNLTKRLARGDRGINKLDRVARDHDIDYSRADNIEDIWKADKKFIKETDKLDGLTANIANKAIRSKLIAEKAGVLDTEKFSGQKAGALTLAGATPKRDPLRNLRRQVKKQEGGFAVLLPILASMAGAAVSKVLDVVINKYLTKEEKKEQTGGRLVKQAKIDKILDIANEKNIPQKTLLKIIEANQ